MYGLRAGVLLAAKKKAGFVTISELSDELDISFYFLTKVLQQLTKAGILKSYKGPNGGVKLNVPAEKISFMDIVIAIDGTTSLEKCALGLPGCGVLKPCPLHDQWSVLKAEIMDMMKNTSLKTLAQRKDELISAGNNVGKYFFEIK